MIFPTPAPSLSLYSNSALNEMTLVTKSVSITMRLIICGISINRILWYRRLGVLQFGEVKAVFHVSMFSTFPFLIPYLLYSLEYYRGLGRPQDHNGRYDFYAYCYILYRCGLCLQSFSLRYIFGDISDSSLSFARSNILENQSGSPELGGFLTWRKIYRKIVLVFSREEWLVKSGPSSCKPDCCWHISCSSHFHPFESRYSIWQQTWTLKQQNCVRSVDRIFYCRVCSRLVFTCVWNSTPCFDAKGTYI